MQKLLSLILCLVLSSIHIYAQNLVPNGDFEQYILCPTGISQVEQCTNWIQPTFGTCDYFNTCSTTPGISVPLYLAGYQYAHSGVAYSGIVTFNDTSITSQTREYIGVAFSSPLIVNNCYYFEMYVNLHNGSKFKSSSLGVYFSDTLIDGITNYDTLSVMPQIQNPLTNSFDTLNWTLVSGTYTAHGGEVYLVIGNFNGKTTSQWTLYNPVGASTYLLIDDVSLTVCTSLEEFNKLDITVAPNPFTDKLVITAKSSEPYELLLTDVTGRQVLKQNLRGNATVQTGNLGKGIYFATVRKKKKVVTVKGY